jgi:hypothetical protein
MTETQRRFEVFKRRLRGIVTRDRRAQESEIAQLRALTGDHTIQVQVLAGHAAKHGRTWTVCS